ncbi:citrulline utilization hydrolase CtlX [Fastidiosibacter lacustris]|uniref:citrulline utilization hydrolase CtlX n=1 Tax=Fastidiosibacter lacustris TaxID=2056695 RepID=UPI000E34969D|nr:arginine deiminase-related protein [Fastidiosibacter lacustris]
MNRIANTVVMVPPTHFAFNEQTAVNNTFQNKLNLSESKLTQQAMTEFNDMVNKIRCYGIEVIVLPSPKENTPDAVFPNNWFSTHEIKDQKYLYIYPMFSKNRQAEVQVEALQNALLQKTGRKYIIQDIRALANGRALEGTGVFIFDHTSKTAFLALSERADIELARKVVEKLGYKLVTFSSTDKNGKPIYHTNVMLAIADKFAVICLEAISEQKERLMVQQKLQAIGKELIDISFEQLYHMAGNVLQLTNQKHEKYLLMSKQAENVLTEAQKQLIDKYCHRLSFDIPTIETVGGGSVRCMLAEVF